MTIFYLSIINSKHNRLKQHEEELFNDSVNEKIPEKVQDHANEENVKNNKEADDIFF